MQYKMQYKEKRQDVGTTWRADDAKEQGGMQASQADVPRPSHRTAIACNPHQHWHSVSYQPCPYLLVCLSWLILYCMLPLLMSVVSFVLTPTTLAPADCV